MRWALSRALTSAPAWSCARTWPTSPCFAAAISASWAFLIAFWPAPARECRRRDGIRWRRSSAAARTTQARHRDRTILASTAEDGSARPGPDHPRPASRLHLSPILQGREPTLGDGRYIIRRELGRGTMGVVYEAEDTVLGSHRRPQDDRARLRPRGSRLATSSSSASSPRRGPRPGSPIRASSSVTTSARTRRAESSSSSSNT